MAVPFCPSVGDERHRPAFTIVELLVVIAIIGVMVSILLPAVNAVRDSAARTENLNNLKQIGTAIASYETSNKTYPPLVKYPTAVKNTEELKRATSWAFEILPFLEAQNVYDKFDRTQPCYHSDNFIAMTTPIPIYANPRRRDATNRSPFASGSGTGASLDYAANGGVVMDKGDPVRLPNDPSGATLVTPYKNSFDPKFSGPFHHNLAVPQAAVKDGLGHTIAVGDRWIGPPVPSSSGPPWNDLAGMAGESLPTIVRFGNADTNSGAGLPFPMGNNDPSIYKFGSVRGSEACFVFLDGHALWIPYDIDPEIFLRLTAINDGFPVPPF